MDSYSELKIPNPPKKKKRPTVAQKPRALVTNICSHCELLACDTTLHKGETLAHAHTPTCKQVDSQHHAVTNLSFF